MELPRKKPTRKSIDVIDLTESNKGLSHKNQQEYAGEGELKNRFNEIVKFKLTGAYPDSIINHPVKYIKNKKIKGFLMTAHNYQVMTEKISPISKSKLCYNVEIKSTLLVVPFKSEIPSILKTLHIENGMHLSLDQTREKAIIYRVKWPGYYSEIQTYINDCMCNGIKKKQVFQRTNF